MSKQEEIKKLQEKLNNHNKLESQYNSDKHVYKSNIEELSNKVNS